MASAARPAYDAATILGRKAGVFDRSQPLEEVWGDTQPGVHAVAEPPEAGSVDAAVGPADGRYAAWLLRGMRVLLAWKPASGLRDLRGLR